MNTYRFSLDDSHKVQLYVQPVVETFPLSRSETLEITVVQLLQTQLSLEKTIMELRNEMAKQYAKGDA